MDIFGPTPVPAWKGPADDRRTNEAIGNQYGEMFNRGFMSQYNKTEERAYAEKQADRIRDMLKPLTGGGSQYSGSSDSGRNPNPSTDPGGEMGSGGNPQVTSENPNWNKSTPISESPYPNWNKESSPSNKPAWMTESKPVVDPGPQNAIEFSKRLKEHPELLIDPRTAPYVQGMIKNWAAIEKVQTDADKVAGALEANKARTIGGQLALADGKQFISRIGKLTGDSGAIARSQINAMKPNPDGTPSPAQLQALGLAEESQAVELKNKADIASTQATMAENQAIASGQEATLTVNKDGSVTKHYAPSTKRDYNAMPKQMVLDNGQFGAWMPGATTMHILKDPLLEAKAKLTWEKLKKATELENYYNSQPDPGSNKDRNEAATLNRKGLEKEYLDLFKKSNVPIPSQLLPGEEPHDANGAAPQVRSYNPATGKIE